MHDNRFMYQKGWKVEVLEPHARAGFKGEVGGMHIDDGVYTYLITKNGKFPVFPATEEEIKCQSEELQVFADRRKVRRNSNDNQADGKTTR